MKRITKSIILAAGVLLVAPNLTFGQEKQTEKKVKIVLTDNKGEKTVLDTVIIGDSQIKTISAKDGKVIYIGSSADAAIHTSGGEKSQVYITISTDDNKNVVISKADSATWTTTQGGKGQIYSIVSPSGSQKNVIMSTVDVDTKDGKKVIIMSGDAIVEGEKVIIGHASTGLKDVNANYSKIVVSRDGVVITIEGEDEAKVKAIIDIIDNELKKKREEPAGKTETKKK